MRYLYISFTLLIVLPSLYGEKIYWRGNINISDRMELPENTVLMITHGTIVTFEKDGYLVCRKGRIIASDSTFIANKPLDGKSRINTWYTDTEFSHCTFHGLIASNKKYHNASIALMYGTHRFYKNKFENCSSFELTLCPKPLLSHNQFDNGKGGLVLFHCLGGYVKNNVFRACYGNAILVNNTNKVSVIENRFFNVGCGVSIYGNSSNNYLIGNSIFNSNTGVRFTSIPSKNSIMTTLFDTIDQGLEIRGAGENNIMSNSVFWRCQAAVYAKKVHPLSIFIIQNSVFGKSVSAVVSSTNGLLLRNNLFFKCKSTYRETAGAVVQDMDSLTGDPLFKAPDAGDFRVKANSPLIGNGHLKHSNIGLFLYPSYCCTRRDW